MDLKKKKKAIPTTTMTILRISPSEGILILKIQNETSTGGIC